MMATKHNKFANGFRWAWKFTLAMFILSLSFIILGITMESQGDISQGIKGITMLPGQFFLAYVVGFFFAKDIK